MSFLCFAFYDVLSLLTEKDVPSLPRWVSASIIVGTYHPNVQLDLDTWSRRLPSNPLDFDCTHFKSTQIKVQILYTIITNLRLHQHFFSLYFTVV